MDGQTAQLSYTGCKTTEVTSSLFTTVSYINSKSEINWKYVGNVHNPADIGSRGCNVESLEDEWWDGPSWLANHEEWPEQKKIIPTRKSEKEAKLIREAFSFLLNCVHIQLGQKKKKLNKKQIKIQWIQHLSKSPV